MIDLNWRLCCEVEFEGSKSEAKVAVLQCFILLIHVIVLGLRAEVLGHIGIVLVTLTFVHSTATAFY